ncbi:MAG: hypothetical protein GWN29_01680 [Gammaproteobacteria bacterium]|nr:hypothetical protein [Gammaproteobacteria bacterium]
MLRTIMITSTAICLSLGSSLALADHDRGLRYVVGGAILGAALGELAYAADVYPAHGYWIYDRGYRRGRAFPPPRAFRRGRAFRDHWYPRPRFRHHHRRAHRHGPWCY